MLKLFIGVQPIVPESSKQSVASFYDLGDIYGVTILSSPHLPHDDLYPEHLVLILTLQNGHPELPGDTQWLRSFLAPCIVRAEIHQDGNLLTLPSSRLQWEKVLNCLSCDLMCD